MYVLDTDPNKLGNGDICIRTDKGTLVALIYSRFPPHENTRVAQIMVDALNSTFFPSHTDLMVSPESIGKWLEENPLPEDRSHEQP
jgi:hypothetical protein